MSKSPKPGISAAFADSDSSDEAPKVDIEDSTDDDEEFPSFNKNVHDKCDDFCSFDDMMFRANLQLYQAYPNSSYLHIPSSMLQEPSSRSCLICFSLRTLTRKVLNHSSLYLC